MNFKSVSIILLSTATVLFPVAVFGQAEPGSMPESMSQQGGQAPSNQPQLPQTQRQNQMPSMQDSTGSNGDRPQATKDKMFVRAAVEGGLAQIQFGQLAAQKGLTDDIKTLGQQMVTDHTALNKDMESAADSIGVMVPKRMNKTDQAEYEKLNSLSGDAFDTEYLIMLVKDHHHDLRAFRVEAIATQDPALREVVAKGAQAIHGHLVMVDKMAKSKGIEVPHHGRQQASPPAR